MNEELKITKERVLSAAGKCGTAKEVLKELFPEAFEVNDGWQDISDECKLKRYSDGDFCIYTPEGHVPFAVEKLRMTQMISGGLSLTEYGGCSYRYHDNRIWRKKS